jgi:hypothetical protein
MIVPDKMDDFSEISLLNFSGTFPGGKIYPGHAG